MQHAHLVLSAWSNYFVVTGSAAAALTGLMFVVVTLISSQRTSADVAGNARTGIAAYSTPTVAHLSVSFLMSGILSAPWRSSLYAGSLVALIGLVCCVYILNVLCMARRTPQYTPDAGDFVFHMLLPGLSYFLFILAGAAFACGFSEGVMGIAAAVMVLICTSIHNAWDVVTYLVIGQAEGSD